VAIEHAASLHRRPSSPQFWERTTLVRSTRTPCYESSTMKRIEPTRTLQMLKIYVVYATGARCTWRSGCAFDRAVIGA